MPLTFVSRIVPFFAGLDTAETDPFQRHRFRFVCSTIALSIVWVITMANWPLTGGWTAATLSMLQLGLYSLYTLRTHDPAMERLLIFGVAFGIVELAADALCVQFTGTLNYAIANSTMLWHSPWWMPLAWMIVALQIGVVGDEAIHRWGHWRGAGLTATLGAINIPFYEEMAYHARWWEYRNCLMIGHTPVYIIVAEFFIGLAIGLLASAALRANRHRDALTLGILGGISTIIGGLIGYGCVEFLPAIIHQ